MKKSYAVIAILALLLVTWALDIYHVGVAPRRQLTEESDAVAGTWIPKDQYGINQLVLSGSPYHRGREAGRLTSELLFEQEKALQGALAKVIPNPFVRLILPLAAMRWYWGIDKYFEFWMLDEMQGVAEFASPEFDSWADGFTRQVGYHGLHEVGQMMVDRGGEGMGCTVFALPYGNSWIVGRNFDFEGGRIFDEQKIVKWVFPDQGNAFVSVIWAGMVGAVTGVNDQGVYISINAAGSSHRRRYGTPTTLVLLKALQFASTAEEARDIIERETVFITDIFVVADSKSKVAWRIEKSPDQTRYLEIVKPTVVTNHLIHADWQNDEVNDFRKRELTTLAREARGEALLKTLPKSFKNARQADETVLKFLRDKGEKNGRPLHLGNRGAIDALIATHSVIYNGATKTLYVSEGPSLAGAFRGFDLARSFRLRRPILVPHPLPADPLVSREAYARVHESVRLIELAQKHVRAGECDEAGAYLDLAAREHSHHFKFHQVKGNQLYCQRDFKGAARAWSTALSLEPAYRAERLELEKRAEKK